MIEEECKALEDLILQKFNTKAKVFYEDYEHLGKWFLLKRNSPYGNFRLGISPHNATSMIGYMEDLPSNIINE